MIIWTIQNIAAWEQLQRDGLLRGDGRRVPLFLRTAYRWMSDQMQTRLATKHAHFPLWGWYQWQGTRRCRPDLRASGYLAKEEIGVRIEIDLPGTSVLLSDFNLWHCVLNYSYLAFNEQEDDEFVHELEEAGVSQMRPYPEPFNHRVLLSWQRIFDLEAGDVEWWGPLSERIIQATFWELTISQVRHVDIFKAR
jgi:hypothetical protein